MTDRKEIDRFGFTQPDECIMVSQCVECIRNLGKSCSKFGDKPIEYVRATSNKKCPERRLKK